MFDDRISKGLIFLFFAAFAIFTFSLVSFWAVDWPRIDDFILIDWLNAYDQNHWFGTGSVLGARDQIHPLATQALISVILFSMFGAHYKYIVFLNILIILSTSFVLYITLYGNGDRPIKRIIAVPIFALCLFNPVQSGHILWGFEVGWFLIVFFLALNALLIERKRDLYTIIFCVMGAFSSAQGLALWPAAAIQIILRDRRVPKVLYVSALGFAANCAFLATLASQENSSAPLPQPTKFIPYFIQLIGTWFGSKDHQDLLTHGLLILVLAFAAGIASSVNRSGRADERVAAGFALFSLLSIAMFGIGRFKFGIDWATYEFHIGNLVVPLILAILMVLFSRLSFTNVKESFASTISIIAIIYLVSGLYTSLPFSKHFAKENQIRLEIARTLSCDPSIDSAYALRLNLDPIHVLLYQRTRPSLQILCSTAPSPATASVLKYPEEFRKIEVEQPNYAAAIRQLWHVYLAHSDLYSAFPPDHANRATELLKFAIHNAATGSLYDPEALKIYETDFANLGKDHRRMP